MKKIIIILYLIIFSVSIYYAVNIFIKRNQENIDPKESNNEKIEITPNQKDTHKNEVEKINEKIEHINIIEKDATYKITSDDCNNECTQITEKNKKNYCQQVCGLTGQSVVDDSCDNKNGLTKDYCLRNQAIKENDFGKCKTIHDGGIRKQCQNRISEEVIDDIM